MRYYELEHLRTLPTDESVAWVYHGSSIGLMAKIKNTDTSKQYMKRNIGLFGHANKPIAG
jgi:hypothetical protein